MITIETQPSKALYRQLDYVVKVDGVTIFHTDSRTEAEFIAIRARMEQA